MLWEMKSRRANIILFLLITKAEELDKLYIDQREKNGNSIVELSGWVEMVEIGKF